MKPNKPFWFAFNTADWLSSKSVRMMSLAERGAYIGLLATSWGEDRPGTLPAAEDTVRRLCEMSPADWLTSGPVLLAMFPLSECGTYRYNPRLLNEAEKREVLSEKKAEAGRKSAELRAAAATQRQQTVNTNPTGVENQATGVGENGNQLQSQLQSHKNKSIAKPGGGEASPSESKNPDATSTRGAGRPAEYHYDEAPVFHTKAFYAHLDTIGYSHVDKAMYLLRISQGAAKGVAEKKLQPQATNEAWGIYIQRWLDKDKEKGKLLLPDATIAATTGNRYNPPAALTPTRTDYSIAERVKAQQTATYF